MGKYTYFCKKKLVRQAGFEPATYGLEGRCSIQLSYWRTMCELGGVFTEFIITYFL